MTVTGNTAQRVKKHRDRLRNEQCSRVEVTIGSDVVDKMKAVARKRGVPLWHVAEKAFELYARQENVSE